LIRLQLAATNSGTRQIPVQLHICNTSLKASSAPYSGDNWLRQPLYSMQLAVFSWLTEQNVPGIACRRSIGFDGENWYQAIAPGAVS